MYRRTQAILAFALLSVLLTVPGCLAADQDSAQGDQARKDKIVANLKISFPQLQTVEVVINELKASGYEGLEEGSFTVGGRQTQKFLISSDDTKLYMISEPIDVSRSAEEVQAEMARQEQEKAAAAQKATDELNAAVEGRPFRGPADAPITVVEFSDFQCPYCSRGAQTVEQLLEKYPGDVRFVFFHFPLEFHPWAKPASIATLCAAEQSPDAFWMLHDAFFANQKDVTPQNVVGKSREFLAGSDIDMEAWSTCASDSSSDAYKAASAKIAADMGLGQRLGVQGTPGFFVNGRFLNGAVPIGQFDAIIQEIQGGATE